MLTKMKLIHVLCLIGLFVASICQAADTATPQEAVQKVKEAAALIKEKGAEAALAVIRDQKGPFVWKDSYVVVTSSAGDMLVHPYNAKLEGKNIMGLKDANGKLFQAEMYNLTKEKGSGWVEHVWVKPGETTPSPKVSFCMKVPGMDYEVIAGVYGFTKKDVDSIQ